jgi:regulation of enolase protein 1 (concanavalin A-like superfamily)
VNAFANLTWLNEPMYFEYRGKDLFVRTSKETDFWRGTFYGFWRDNGHFLYKSVTGDFSAEVTICGDFKELYDQAGLMVRLSESHWIKAGLEYTDDALHFSVVANNDNSDWSQMRVGSDNGLMRLRLSRHAEAIRVQYLDQNDNHWKTARLSYLPKTDSIDVGVMCCSPKREGFEVTFKNFIVGEPISKNLHDQ